MYLYLSPKVRDLDVQLSILSEGRLFVCVRDPLTSDYPLCVWDRAV